MILTVVNHKGGTGKTTTAVSLAAFMARARRRVLVVDLDPQGSAGLALGLEADTEGATMADVLRGAPIAGAVRTTPHAVDLVPAAIDLAGIDLELVDAPHPERRLERALAPMRDRYDVILVDCAPSLSLLTVNALTAADRFLVPLVPHYLAVHGLAQLEQFAADVRTSYGTGAALLGVAIVAADYRQAATRETVGIIRGHYGRQVFRTEVRQSVKLVEAPSYGRPISHYAPTSPAAVQYDALTHEVLSRLKRSAA